MLMIVKIIVPILITKMMIMMNMITIMIMMTIKCPQEGVPSS